MDEHIQDGHHVRMTAGFDPGIDFSLGRFKIDLVTKVKKELEGMLKTALRELKLLFGKPHFAKLPTPQEPYENVIPNFIASFKHLLRDESGTRLDVKIYLTMLTIISG